MPFPFSTNRIHSATRDETNDEDQEKSSHPTDPADFVRKTFDRFEAATVRWLSNETGSLATSEENEIRQPYSFERKAT